MLHPTAEFRFKYGRFLEAAIRSEGYCRRDRENREMIGERAGFGHISLNLVVHAKTQPSSDSPDLHG